MTVRKASMGSEPSGEAAGEPEAVPRDGLARAGGVQDSTAEAQMRGVFGRMAEYAIVAVFVLSITVYEWVRWAFQQPPQPVVVTIFGGLLLAYLAIRVAMGWPRYREAKVDVSAQREVRRVLRDLGDRGFYVFEPPGADGDLVSGTTVVGPQGVFALTFRTFSRRGVRGEHIDHAGPGNLVVGGHEAVGNPLDQARGIARWVEGVLEAQAVRPAPPVQPVLVCAGWRLGKQPAGAGKRDVWVANEDTLARELAPLGASPAPPLSSQQVIACCEALERVMGGRTGESRSVV